MGIEVVAGNIGTGKTAYVLQKLKSGKRFMYLDVETLTRSLCPDPIMHDIVVAVRQGLIKDFLRRTLPSTDVIIETTAVTKSARKSIATMVRNVAEEKKMTPSSYSVLLTDFGPGSQKALGKACSHPVILAGGDAMKEKVVERFVKLQKDYDRPGNDEGYAA